MDGGNIRDRDLLMRIIALLFSLAGTVEQLYARRRRVDGHMLRMLLLSEQVALNIAVELLTGVEAPHPEELACDAVDAAERIIDRRAYLIALSQTYRQLALSLSVILAMRPRAFRDRPCGGAIEAALARETGQRALPRAATTVLRSPLAAGLRVRAPPWRLAA